jgi:integrase
MAMKLVASGRKLMGLKLMIDHDCYLRPGESIGIAKKDVVKPVKNGGPQYQWYSVVIRDQEDGRADKVGIFDNTIPFNSPARQYLGELLSHRADCLNSSLDKVFPFTADEYRKRFAESGAQLGVTGLHPYQCRHGGASEDLNSKEREPLAVKARGRWATDQSVRRYGKVGKLQKLLSQLSPSNLGYCQWSLRNMEAVLRGTMSARSR